MENEKDRCACVAIPSIPEAGRQSTPKFRYIYPCGRTTSRGVGHTGGRKRRKIRSTQEFVCFFETEKTVRRRFASTHLVWGRREHHRGFSVPQGRLQGSNIAVCHQYRHKPVGHHPVVHTNKVHKEEKGCVRYHPAMHSSTFTSR